MWVKWSQAIGIKFARAWKALALPIEVRVLRHIDIMYSLSFLCNLFLWFHFQPRFDAWCHGFGDKVRNASVGERHFAMSDADQNEFIEPVTKELNAEALRQREVVRFASLPDEITKLQAKRLEEANQKQETLEAIDAAITKMQERLAQGAPSDKVVRTVLDLVDLDKVSYCFAFSWAGQFPRHWGLTAANTCSAFKREIHDQPMPFEAEEFDAILYYITNGITFEKKLNQQKEIARNFLTENAAKPGVNSTASGLQYSLTSAPAVSTAVRPTDSSRIVYHARGGRHRGRAQFSTGGMDEDDAPSVGTTTAPFSDRVIDLIDGLREGVKLMRVGETFRFWVEAKLAWEEKFALGGTLFPHDVLQLDLKLIDVEDLSDAELRTASTNDQCDGDKCERGAFTLRSEAFKDGESLPGRYTCEAGRVGFFSPPLSWTGAPEDAKSFVVLVTKHDANVDATKRSDVHWLMYDIPANVTSLTSGATPPEGAKHGQSLHADRAFYVGPCGSSEAVADTFLFNLFALKTASIGTERNLALSALAGAIEANTIASAQLRATVRKGEGVIDVYRTSLHKSIDKLPEYKF
jgi:Raf kinase inhibitor-like YbhB/YbcL family protein